MQSSSFNISSFPSYSILKKLFCKYENSQFNTNNMSNIIEHVFQAHAHDFNFSIKCSIFKCENIFYYYEDKKHGVSNHQKFESSTRVTSFLCVNNECTSIYENYNDFYAHFLQENFEKKTLQNAFRKIPCLKLIITAYGEIILV